jgi:hypothetical protein
MTSRQVAWAAVYRFIEHQLPEPGSLPLPGTPAWCAMSDDDQAKRDALLWPVIYWAITEDARQTAMCEASRAISASHGRCIAEEARLLHRRGGVSYHPRRKEPA